MNYSDYDDKIEKRFENSDTIIYLFLCHPRGDRSKIKVVEERYKWKLSDYALVGGKEKTFHSLRDAVKASKEVAKNFDLEYVPFTSHYVKFNEQDFINKSIDNEISDFLDSLY